MTRPVPRRDVISGLARGLTGLGLARWAASASQPLDRFFPAGKGTAILVDIRSRRLIAAANVSAAARSLAPPGSTLKPFVLAALLRSGKLDAGTSFACPGRLRIGARVLNCSHPRLAVPVRVDTALAYSCNCFVAHAAERFAAGELARELEGLGLAARTGLVGDDEATGRIRAASGGDAQRLQALGEDGVLITTAELAMAYHLLALKSGAPEMRPILAGLEGAVEYGTAQNARVTEVKVAGKTGTAITTVGEPIAWFAGFLPSAAPEAVIAVMLPGRSGGADAAPVGGRILEAYTTGRL
jgi:peptidoglycan glycosyltransferase